jgi:NAD(P)-dependent dehydrogenase (short-subunit alcohol dehydrogenase family)
MKRALVTGCSRGIGRAITEALLADGWEVVGLSRTCPPIKHPAFGWHHADLSSGYAVHTSSYLCEPSLDALIHCAADQGPVAPFAGDPGHLGRYAHWLSCVRTNLFGTYYALDLAMPYLLKSDDGRALLFAGGGAFNPRPNYSAYAAAKAGVVGLMETVSAELEGTSVTVNCVSPGRVPTPMLGLPDQGSPEMDRVLACVRHLLSPAAKGLTGKTVSAEYDEWAAIRPETVASLNDSVMGTRHRYKIWGMADDGSFTYRTDANQLARAGVD